LQPRHLVFVALDHLAPLPNQMVLANHTQSPLATPRFGAQLPEPPFDSCRYGSGIRQAARCWRRRLTSLRRWVAFLTSPGAIPMIKKWGV
jgi:hypothetical protein